MEFSRMKLGAILQCFNNITATRHTLYNFRKWYPDTDIVLICDGGLDFTKVAKEFKCHYIYSSINIKLNVLTKLTAIEVFKRLKMAVNEITEEWVMFLEDDVLLRGEIDPKITGDMMGGWTGNMLGDEVRQYTNAPIGAQYGGCGGTILNAKFIKNQFSQEKTRKFLEYFALDDQKNGFSDNRLRSIDYLITSLFYLHGGLYGPLEGFAECTHHSDWQNNQNYKVIHQMKNWSWQNIPEPPIEENYAFK